MTAAPPVALILGFGPFADIRDNPAARLARAVRGRRAGRLRLEGMEMPVSYARSPRLALERAAALGAVGVLGVGVARGRSEAAVERFGYNAVQGDDVDGFCPGRLDPLGPDRVPASADTAALATALQVERSDDPGRYVCSAWLYRVARAGRGKRLPVAFLHIPDAGFDPDRLVRGLAVAWGDGRPCMPLEPSA